MPIYVNTGGGSLASVGEGMAAGQQYLANQQKMRVIDQEAAQRSEKFQLEKQIALRSLELDEQQFDLQRSQLEQQQYAEADMLTAQALEQGLPGPQAEAFRQAASRVSPQFRRQMLEDSARSMRYQAEQQRLQGAMADLEATPEIAAEVQSRIDSGEIRTPAQLERAVASAKGKVARQEMKLQERERAVATWDAWQADPLFTMPDEDEDPEAYADVQDLVAELKLGAPRDSAKYTALADQLMVLTNPKTLKAAKELLKRDLGKMEDFGSGMLEKAAADPGLQSMAEDSRRDDYAKAYRAKADAAPNVAGTPQASTKPGTMLKEPLPQKLASGMVMEHELVGEIRQAMEDYGFTTRPEPGSPDESIARQIVAEVTKRYNARRLQEREADLQSQQNAKDTRR